MLFLKLFIVYSFAPLISKYVICNLSETHVIKKYVHNQISPVQTTIFTCWKQQKIAKVLEELSKSVISVAIFTNFSKIAEITLSDNSLVITDAKCNYFEDLLETAEKLNLFKVPYKWLVLNGDEKILPVKTNILIDSNFAMATKIDNSFEISLFYKLTENSTNFVRNDLGVLSDNSQYLNHFLPAKNRSNVMGSSVTVSYVLTKPAYPIDLVNYRNQHVDGVSKLCYAIVYNVLELLNCTKNFIPRKTWGYKRPNETYYDGGMFGDIQNGTADIAGTVGFFTMERYEIIEYLAATTPSDMKFILRAPPLSHVNNLFTLPFESNVWYGLYLITGFTVIVLYVTVIYENRYKKALKKANNIEDIKPNFFDVVMLQIGAITQQGSEAEPKSSGGRIAVFIVFLGLMFLYTAYSANIVVLLQSSSSNIRTLEDLLYSQINLGVEDFSYTRYFFSIQQEPVRKAIYTKKVAPQGQKSNFMTVEEGIKRVREEFFGFHVETTSGYKVMMDTFLEHEKCGLIEIEYLSTFMPSMSLRKNTPYKEILRVGFRRIYENGIYQRHTNRIYYKKPQCRGKGGSFTSVGIIDAYFPFAAFSVGILLSLWILMMEIFVEKYFKDRLEWMATLKFK